MSSFKQLSKSDVTVVANQANKQWTLPYCPYPTSSDYLTIYKGTNVTGAFSADNDPVTEGEYERLVYAQINQMFYQTYTASLNTSSLMFTLNNYQSASQQRPTSSYFIYNDNDNLIVNFPTGAMDGIRVVAINQSVFGNKVLPGNFQLSSSAYNVKDDAYGNLFDYSGSKTHVGNIFYAQGLAIVTNQDYQLMFPLPPLAKNDSGSFLTTDSPKIISASLNDDPRSGTLNTGSIILSGSTSDLAYWSTGSNGTIALTTTTAGTYTIYYTIAAQLAGSCPTTLRSNKAKVVATVTEPTTTSTTTTTTTLTPTTSTTTTTTTSPSTTTTTTSTTTTTTTAPPTTTTTTTTSTTTTTTTCTPQNAQSMYYNYDTGLPAMFGTSSADAACNLLVSSSVIYYSASLALTNGTPLYHNECLTIPITASAYTDTSQQYFKIGPYYVNFETDKYTVRSVTACPTTTTTSTTTTTTTADPYYYYSVSKFDCGSSCAYVSPDLVARSSTSLSTIDGVYYKPIGSFTYQIQTEITPAPPSFNISLDGAPSNANCISACSL
jgi:hypothetical protein